MTITPDRDRDRSRSQFADFFAVGEIVGFHGVAGEVKIKPQTNNLQLLLCIKEVVAQKAEGAETFKLQVSSRRADKRTLFLRFAGYKDRNAVEPLLGAFLYVRPEELQALESEEFWVKDLVGLDVYTTAGQFVGQVCSIIYGGNDVLEIRRPDDPPDKTVLVPFVKDLVPVVDLKGRRLEVVELPGLLEAQ